MNRMNAVSEITKVNFVDIPRQYHGDTAEIVSLVQQLMDGGEFVGGPVLERFEKALAAYTEVDYAVGCSDGTMALVLALLASGMKKDDRVIVPTNSYIASANAVIHAGGEPVFVDCDPETYLLDLNATEDALKKHGAKFVMPVHLYGNPCPMDQVIDLADRYGAQVIEDNAQALGASYAGRKTGSFGVAAGVSFYPAKNLGAFGQGGALLTNDASVAKAALTYREQGQGSEKYYHEVVGYNSRLHTVQAGILEILLRTLDGNNSNRSNAAEEYRRFLPADRLQATTPGGFHIYHLFEYRCETADERKRVAEALRQGNIGFGYHYPLPIHKQKAYEFANNFRFPVSERLANTLISLPMHPHLGRDEIEHVCETLKQAIA